MSIDQTLVLPIHLAFEEWDLIGIRITAAQTGVQWWAGDLMFYREQRYDDQVQCWMYGMRQYFWINTDSKRSLT